jgi:O-antigen chain-terminating methyltransferase
MSQSADSDVDVLEVMEQVRTEVRRRRWQTRSRPSTPPFETSAIQALLNQAESKTVARTALPRILDRFPFNRSKVLERLVLKAHTWATHDQRLGLSHVVQAGRELLEANRRLHAKLAQLEEAMRSLDKEIKRLQTTRLDNALPADGSLDPLYLALENRFRGSEELIRERLSIYLPLVEGSGAGGTDSPVVDLGCARGEWLELLRERGLHAVGVDLNWSMVAACRDRGLEVVGMDALQYLRGLAADSVGAVTGFHFIEHIELRTLVAVLDETLRVLRPGGLAIFETPNPANLIVGSCNFYLDPTHRNPIPRETARFLLEVRGFADVEIRELNPPDPAVRLADDGTAIAQRFNDHFYAPQDYSVIGYRRLA